MDLKVKIDNNLYLAAKEIEQSGKVKKDVKTPTNFICVIDVSYSMSYDLTLIRKQLKNKLPSLVKENDTITIIWFSGKDQAGVLMEEVEINSLTSLQKINENIDRYLKPIGLTAFDKPLLLTNDVIKRIKNNRKNSIFSLIFLTDGYNNNCSWSDVLNNLKTLDQELASSTFVEYGYYCDTKAISTMAEILGGEKVEAKNFDDYDIIFEKKMTQEYTSSKKILIKLNEKGVLYDTIFTINDNSELLLYKIDTENNQVFLPENTKFYSYFSTNPFHVNEIVEKYNLNYLQFGNKYDLLLYLSLYILVDKLEYDNAEKLFSFLGDRHLYSLYVNAYGKQKLFDLKSKIKETFSNPEKRFISGRFNNIVINPNAYCIMDFVEDILDDDNALLHTEHNSFEYKRIGAKKVENTVINEELKEKINKAETINELKELINNIDDVIKFEKYPINGTPINNLVWNSNRANLNINVKYNGYVNLPKNKFNLDKIDTFIYRNYNIIKDGIVNLPVLPLSLSRDTFNKLKKNKLVDGEYISNKIYEINISNLPIVNRTMVKNISAKELARKEFELLKIKASKKVYDYYQGLYKPKTSVEYKSLYSDEAIDWLKELGITSYNGFSPSVKLEKTEDFYYAILLETKIAKCSSIPKVENVLKKMESGKELTLSEKLLEPSIKDFQLNINNEDFQKLYTDEDKVKIIGDWVELRSKDLNKKRKKLIQEIAQIKFSLILSKKWFIEFSSFDENQLSLDIYGEIVNFTFDMSEKEEYI